MPGHTAETLPLKATEARRDASTTNAVSSTRDTLDVQLAGPSGDVEKQTLDVTNSTEKNSVEPEESRHDNLLVSNGFCLTLGSN